MSEISFIEVCDQVASMLGADSTEELPAVDAARVRISVNQAYRECYSPIDGRRPRWATRKYTLVFEEDMQEVELDPEVIDVEKTPVLVGHGPLSPMNSRSDEIRARSFHGGDFRPVGIYRGSFPSINMEEPEKDRPIWYFIDQTDNGDDAQVVPKFVVYPVPDKEYSVDIVANIVPKGLEIDEEVFRIPGDLVYDIVLPIAQHKMLVDPRYNGDNKEIIMRSAAEARKRLSTLVSPQKHKNLRLGRRAGW